MQNKEMFEKFKEQEDDIITGVALSEMFLIFLAHIAVTFALGFIFGVAYGLIFFAVMCIVEILFLRYCLRKHFREFKETQNNG